MGSVNIFVNSSAALAGMLLGFSAVAAPALADTTITIAGSTALLPLVKDAAAEYHKACRPIRISCAGTGSS